MKRPVSSDQVKLFLFGLLRTVSALASTTPTDARFAAAAASSRPSSSAAVTSSSSGHTLTDLNLPCTFTLRLARRTDVPSIQRCNLATLPENYNQQFYANHLRQWPELAFVAVETPVNESPARSSSSSSSLLFSSSFPGQVEEKVVAYVLGKVEERTVLITDENDLTEADWEEWASSRRKDDDRRTSNSVMIRPPVFTTERLGHVTSLAVLEPYRRRGLALELMKQLHYHLRVHYHVPAVGLHVRQSNAAAEKLYRQFGYACDERIEGYYQDGEDAYFMKKMLPPVESASSLATSAANSAGGGGIFSSLRRQHRPWETGPMHLRLPRMVGMPPPIEPISSSSSSSSSASSVVSKEEEEETPELLTGTM